MISTCLSLPFSYEMGEMGLQSYVSEPEVKEHQCNNSGCAPHSYSKAFGHFVPRGSCACCLPRAAVSSGTSLLLCSHPVIPTEREKLICPALLLEAARTALTAGGGEQAQSWCRANGFLFFCCSFISPRSLLLPATGMDAVGRPFCGTDADPSLGMETGTW